MRAWISRLIPATRGVGSSFFFFLGRGRLVLEGVRPKMSAASRAEAMVEVEIRSLGWVIDEGMEDVSYRERGKVSVPLIGVTVTCFDVE